MIVHQSQSRRMAMLLLLLESLVHEYLDLDPVR